MKFGWTEFVFVSCVASGVVGAAVADYRVKHPAPPPTPAPTPTPYETVWAANKTGGGRWVTCLGTSTGMTWTPIGESPLKVPQGNSSWPVNGYLFSCPGYFEQP